MALIGGGGAPNVAGGSNPSGTGTGLSFVGNHAYGYSGIVSTVSDNEMTLLKDNMPTGGYFVGTAQFSYANLDSDDVIFQIKIIEDIIFRRKYYTIIAMLYICNLSPKVLIPRYRLGLAMPAAFNLSK